VGFTKKPSKHEGSEFRVLCRGKSAGLETVISNLLINLLPHLFAANSHPSTNETLVLAGVDQRLTVAWQHEL
jgi:hypothetical protein